tara:strand:+ start:332 stop:595 length:264 start_codon:yes stop_codon:yes gene_type:complete
MPRRLSPIEKEKFLKKILIEKIGKTKIKNISKKENILKKGIIDSMDFADIFFSIEKRLNIKIPFLKIFGKNNNITITNLKKCLKSKN